MAVQFSSTSTIQLPRLIIALAVIVCIAGAASFAVSGASVSVIIPASVVVGMGLYYNGARRYDVMNDKIRIFGVPGERDLLFSKIHGFDDSLPESFAAHLQSLITGAKLSSAIRVEANRSFFSRQNYLWVDGREAFLRAALDALTTQARTAIQTR